ncbi:UvrB/UvrC motif-containing protein [Sutcliffiella deserti]|uniref:UvrB/UvrC motif-containing protein n=1 Tax=Sutcliffiella deserti TaxID=2875501 RepID=UPI001CBD2BB4|nr:UvrB/UvrC motif-containing protein [Sutcliffiella deserti]
MNLKLKARALPSSPGVYLMKDSLGHTIYVGKSKSLKSRVSSYFGSSENHAPKIRKLVTSIREFDFIETDTEFEAFILEWQLIQQIKPIYNSRMKNPLAFPYLVIPKAGEYRRISVSTVPLDTSSFHCFGPYNSKRTVEKAMEALKEAYNLQCSSPNNKKSYCLNYSLGRCNGLCKGGQALEEHEKIISKLLDFLYQNNIDLTEDLKQKMHTAVEKLEFEKAAFYRNSILSMKYLHHKEAVIDFTKNNNNLLIMEKTDLHTVKLFLIRRTDICYSEKFNLQDGGSASEDLHKRLKKSIRKYFSDITKKLSNPDVSRYEIDKAQIIYRYLNNPSTNYIIIQDAWLDSDEETELDNKLASFLHTFL